jgi:ubiquinone/menaquinone biosynthesis C-methylase UbiE
MSQLYDRIGGTYDATRRADPLIAARLRALLDVHGDGVYLDLGCGTGNYTAALAQGGGSWCGVDAAPTMIAAARLKSRLVKWCLGDAAALPIASATVDGVLCVLAIHHFRDRLAVFTEVRRVLRPGGRFIAFTAGRSQMRQYWLNRYFPDAMSTAIQQMPDLADVEAMLRQVNLAPVMLEPYSAQPDLQDSFLYSGKPAPKRYLDAQFRTGISTFANLASPREIEEGCRRLAADIETGRIRQVVADSPSPEGDYLFLVASAT